MTRTVLALIGVAVLGLAAGGVYRELTSVSKNPKSASFGGIAATNGAPDTGGAASSQLIPDLHFIDSTGAQRSLADFRGRVILLNLWATWCVPCRKEMPTLDRLQAALGGPEFEVLALSMDRGGINTVKSFYQELGVRNLSIYVDQNGEALNKLGSVGIPLTMLVDRGGRELWRVLGPREWDQPEEVRRIRSHLMRSPTP